MDKRGLDRALTAIRIAIQTEKDGREFYLRAAEKTNDPQGKALFGSLADDELGHLRLLETQQGSLLQNEAWMPRSELGKEDQPAKVAEAPIFSRQALDRDINAYTSELSALRMALLIENDAVAFYSKAASETDDPNGNAMYQYLVDMEREHQRILQQEYNALAKEFWSTMGFQPF